MMINDEAANPRFHLREISGDTIKYGQQYDQDSSVTSPQYSLLKLPTHLASQIRNRLYSSCIGSECFFFIEDPKLTESLFIKLKTFFL